LVRKKYIVEKITDTSVKYKLVLKRNHGRKKKFPKISGTHNTVSREFFDIFGRNQNMIIDNASTFMVYFYKLEKYTYY
jgi:hypothetical protein